MSLKYILLEKSLSSSKIIQNYLHLMCDNFIPPLSEVVDINLYSKKIALNADCFFVENNGEYIGFLAMYTNNCSENIAFISSISVIPKYQGTGISHNLMNIAIEHAKKKGFQTIRLEVNKNNYVAMLFYLKNTFKVESLNHDTITMFKNI